MRQPKTLHFFLHQIASNGFIVCLLLCLQGAIQTEAQCNLGIVPGTSCAMPTCLPGEGMCFETGNNPPPGIWQNFCGPNTAVHNPQFFTFVADSTNVYFEISVDVCSGQGCGLQFAMSDSCSFAVDEVLSCDPGAPMGATMIMYYTEAVPGQTYYLMIDGCAGEICQYHFQNFSGIHLPDVMPVTVDICDEVLEYQGGFYEPGTYYLYDDSLGCDVLIELHVQQLFEASLPAIEICSEDSVFVEVQVDGISGGYTFFWNDGFTTQGRWIYADQEGDTVSVTVTDSTGCIHTENRIVQRVLDLSLSADVLALCPDSAFSPAFEVFPAGGIPPYTFTWSAEPPGDIVEPGIYGVTVTDANGCSSGAEFEAVESGITFPLLQYPMEELCADGLAEGVLVGVLNGIYDEYSWCNGTTTQFTVMTEPTLCGLVTDEVGCSYGLEIALNVIPEPEAEFSYETFGDSVVFTNLSTGAETIYWDFGDAMSSQDENPAHVFEAPGLYQVLLAIANACGVDTIIQDILVDFTALGKLTAIDLEVAPNPSTGLVGVLLPENWEGVSARIYDHTGKCVLNLDSVKVFGRRCELDLSTLTEGMYVLELSSGEFRGLARVVLSK